MNAKLEKIYRPSIVRHALNLWPPFWGAGIKILSISQDFRHVEVRLKFRWWNKNANRSQYGGSMFSLTDPIYALMLMGILGKEYYVWDKQASINFIKPGLSNLYASFEITQGMINDIYAATQCGEKCFPECVVYVKDEKGEVVAEVQRSLYVRKKRQYRENQA